MTLQTAAPETLEKHGRLEGGAITSEVMDSSKTVLRSAWGHQGQTTGLQQWFTPEPISKLVTDVLGNYQPILDTTAGNGAMLQAFRPEMRFGIEIDPDHASKANYHAIQGDAQKIVPIIRAAGVSFKAIAINPPYGLMWADSAHAEKVINSTALAYLWSLDLLDTYGQGAILCGTARLDKEILSRPEGDAIHTIIDIAGEVWPGVTLPVSLSFFVHPKNRRQREGYDRVARLTSSMEDLHATKSTLRVQRYRSADLITQHPMSPIETHQQWKAIAAEHERRRSNSKKDHRYDMSLRGAKVAAHPSAYARLVLAKSGANTRSIDTLNGSHVNYFAQNTRDWREIERLEGENHITVDPKLKARVTEVIAEAAKTGTPLFPVKPQMRLGWLTELDRIRCKASDDERGFVAGKTYHLATRSKIKEETEMRVVEKKDGEPELRKFKQERKLLEIVIHAAKAQTFDESPENIDYLISHFDIPDPGCVATRFPEDVKANMELLQDIEREIADHHHAWQADQGRRVFEKFRLKRFQKDHMSRLLTKKRGPLAHEQGLGKTLMAMVLAEASVRLGARNQRLFIVPQDLIPQWQREAKKFFGREIEAIRNTAQARDVAERINAGEEGWWITYFEALSLVGRKYEAMPETALQHKTLLAERLRRYKAMRKEKSFQKLLKSRMSNCLSRFANAQKGAKRPGGPQPVCLPAPNEEVEEKIATTKHACPECRMDTAGGWNGEVCKECGYVHRRILVKPGYTHLTAAFSKGVICVDELSEIRGDDSKRSKAIRALARGPWKWGMTGTPLSNYINDAYWGLWWTLGNASVAFPYDYAGGKAKFETDFCVIEFLMGKEEDAEGHVRKRRKVLPKVTNVSQFWRLTQPSVSRCRKEQTGEPLVQRTYHPIRVPMGRMQEQSHRFWLNNFCEYFGWKYPDHPLVTSGMIEHWAKAAGQLWRLESAATMPAEDEATKEWPLAQEKLQGVSNYTPASLKVLELAVEHAQRGEKVLIGSDLIATGKWLADRLNDKGIRAVHIVEERAGKIGTKNPKKRASEVQRFVQGNAQVMCAGVNAMKLGHNLDVASTVIVHGLPYSHMVMDQFIARVHRLTSTKPVSVYVIIPKGSLAEQKWTLLKDKGGASDLAFDGELYKQQEEAVDWGKILQEMKARGIRAAEDTILEADVKLEWDKLATLYIPTAESPAPTTKPEQAPATVTRLKIRTEELAPPARYEQVALF